MTQLLQLSDVSKQYDENTPVLQGVHLEMQAGESLAVVGPSGCGKSTLLNIIGSLDQATSGTVIFEGRNLQTFDERETAAFRNDDIGWVFQFHHLLPSCTILENVLVPAVVHGRSDGARDRAQHYLERVGLSHRLQHRPAQLSGGERQRAAVVRALINQPKLLLADEPTGSLNRAGATELVDVLLELNREEDLALLVVTHSTAVAERMGRTLELREGVLV